MSPSLWHDELRRLPWLGGWSAQELEALRELCERFLARKSMTGVHGLVLTAPMQLHIAAQACVPISRLGLSWYQGWSGIVVYPAAFRVRRRVHGADGVVQEYDAELSGESWDGGPVILSWEDAAGHPGTGEAGSVILEGNVVVHEFAHKLDLLDGEANGIPPFDRRLHPGLRRDEWQEVLEDAYGRFCAELELIDAGIPPDMDPDGPDAAPRYSHLPLDPYAETDEAEFFAVSSEVFFLDSGRLEAAFPRWHALLRRFYRPAP